MTKKVVGRSLTRRRFLRLGGAVAGVGLLSAGSSSASQPTAARPAAQALAAVATKPAGPKKGGTLTMARSASMTNFSGVSFQSGNHPFIRALYNTLVRLDDDMNPQPELAQSWQFSPDGLVMTLKLRQGVKFHSGKDFIAEDVKFSWQYSTDAVTGSPQMRNMYQSIMDVKARGDFTIDLVLEKPNALIFDILDTLAMFDRSAVDKISTTDAGSGPFRVVSYIPGSEIRMKRFDGYWEPSRPYLDEYIVKQIPDASTLVVNLETKAVDAIQGPPLNDVPRLKAQAGMVADASFGSSEIYQLAASVLKPPLSNKKVRQAINYAIDRERICRTILNRTVDPTCLMWPKVSWAYFADLEGRYKYDLDKAKSLLIEAGYPNGFETTLLMSRQLNPDLARVAVIINGDLAKIGIQAQLLDLENNVYNTRFRGGKIDLAVQSYGRANRDPGATLAGAVAWVPKGAAASPTGFDLPDFVTWRDEAMATLNREKRKAIYRKIQELVLDESFCMPIAGNQPWWVYYDYVKDVSFTRESCVHAGDVWLNK